MATTTMTFNPELITVPGNTNENDINFDGILLTRFGIARIERVSGTSVQINANGVTITAASPALTTGNPVMEVPIRKGQNIKMKGGAGAETFLVIIRPQGEQYQC